MGDYTRFRVQGWGSKLLKRGYTGNYIQGVFIQGLLREILGV